MLDFGFSEILLTSAIALVVLGPERLPKVARQVGNWMGRARAMARQLSEQLDREVSADELLKQRTRAGAPGAPGAPGAAVPPPPISTPADPPHIPAPFGGSAAVDPGQALNPQNSIKPPNE